MDFFISDTHFFHKNIIKYSNRPFSSVEEMNEQMILRWNQKVKDGDRVFHLGDFGFAPKAKLQGVFDRLNGQKHLIRGNHDHDAEKLYGWVWVKDMYEPKINGIKVVMCHYGMRVWNESHRGAIQLYGHSHGTLPGNTQSMDVGVDTGNNFYPYSFDEVVAKLKTLPEYKLADYHGTTDR